MPEGRQDGRAQLLQPVQDLGLLRKPILCLCFVKISSERLRYVKVLGAPHQDPQERLYGKRNGALRDVTAMQPVFRPHRIDWMTS